jgi:Kef-type K+ transport system membrane component KefB
MQDAHAFLTSLTVVLAVAAVTTVVFQHLRQPVVLGYIIAGLIVGLRVGDVLAVAGTHEAIEAAKAALVGRETS